MILTNQTQKRKLVMQIKRIPDSSDPAKIIDFNGKITEIENKILSITGLATNSALTAVENKTPNVSSLVTKTEYNPKISDIKKNTYHGHDKYITTPEFNKLTTENFKARLKRVDLLTKRDFNTKLQRLNEKKMLKIS